MIKTEAGMCKFSSSSAPGPPPWPEAILFGFQHYLVMLGTTVLIPSSLVPQMGGGNEEKAQVIQTLLFGSRLPAVIGGSYTFVPATISIIHAGRFNDEPDPKEVLYGSGSSFKVIIIFAIMMSQILKRFCMRTRICVEIVLPEIIILVVFSQYIPHMIKGQPGALKLPHTQGPGRGPTILVYCTQPHMMKGEKSIFDRFAVMFSVAIVWFYAYILIIGGAYKNSAPKTQTTCRTDSAGIIGGAPWIRVPYPFQWGAPTFDAAEIFAMMAASLVALVESTGAFIAVSRYSSATPNPPSVLSRGVGWQGVGIMLSGIFGTGNGSSVSVENAGLLALTRVGSRRVVQISSGFMIFFSILGKFGATFASIPAPIVAALYFIFFAYVGSGGISFLQFCNLNNFRTKFVLGFSIFLGLSIPQYFNEYTRINGFGPVHTRARWFNDIVNVPFQSKAFVAGVVAYFLDNTLHKKESYINSVPILNNGMEAGQTSAVGRVACAKEKVKPKYAKKLCSVLSKKYATTPTTNAFDWNGTFTISLNCSHVHQRFKILV